jgi:hypothetical protein
VPKVVRALKNNKIMHENTNEFVENTGDTFVAITHYVMNKGLEGFTNSEIKEDLGNCFEFDKVWRNFKASARRGLNNGKECMFYENGRYAF